MTYIRLDCIRTDSNDAHFYYYNNVLVGLNYPIALHKDYDVVNNSAKSRMQYAIRPCNLVK